MTQPPPWPINLALYPASLVVERSFISIWFSFCQQPDGGHQNTQFHEVDRLVCSNQATNVKSQISLHTGARKQCWLAWSTVCEIVLRRCLMMALWVVRSESCCSLPSSLLLYARSLREKAIYNKLNYCMPQINLTVLKARIDIKDIQLVLRSL